MRKQDREGYKSRLALNPDLVYPKYQLKAGTWMEGTIVDFFTFVKDLNSNYHMPVADRYVLPRYSTLREMTVYEERFYQKCSLVQTKGTFNEQTAIHYETNS